MPTSIVSRLICYVLRENSSAVEQICLLTITLSFILRCVSSTWGISGRFTILYGFWFDTFELATVKQLDIKIAEFFEEERQNFRTRDANHIMPKTKIPDLTWENWTPATVNYQDKLAVAKGQVENLECHCIECSPEIEEFNTVVEIAEIITPPVQEKLPETPTNTHKWNPITSFYRNIFPYSFEED